MHIKGKMKDSSKRWINRQLRDLYVKRANSDGYRSRAAYKLLEIDDKFHLIKNAKCIVDLGAAPGGWCQVLSQVSDDDAKIVAVDLVEFAHVNRVRHIVGNFEDKETQAKILDYAGCKFDLIVSDMAPSTIGHRQSDHLRIMRLVEDASYFAQNNLKNGGSFVAKIFQGGEEKHLTDTLKQNFKKVSFFKPKSSRKESAEIYIVATQYVSENVDQRSAEVREQ